MTGTRPRASRTYRVPDSAPAILTMNGGSSSLRFAVYEAQNAPRLRLAGKIDRIGLSGTTLTINDAAENRQTSQRVRATDHRAVTRILMDWLEAQPAFASVAAVGHRVVHGMRHSEPQRVTPKLVAELRRATPYDPDHLRREVGLITAIAKRHPALPQVVCFDSAFHRTMPRVAKLLPLPRRYAAKGIERYGFHGLSYAYLMEELERVDPTAAAGRVILAHLGNGASLAAVREGRSVDTSMGFTPASGLMMGTRTGDIDPGIAYHLARTERMSAAQFQRMVTHESGLLGVSGTGSDLRDLLAREAHDARAAEAVALFCYQAKKWIGAFAAVLGGVDTLIFAGGIGEHAPLIRARICDGLGFLGVQLYEKANDANAAVVSPAAGRVTVRVIRTDEDLMIARSVTRVLGFGQHSGT
ncbi:MAG TPA: acetate/propionate family kinase [Gemmatimonadaceae bacterium]